MQPFIGQIQMFGFNFPPRGWAFCDGQLLAISSNSALFSLLGTTFGGDGRTTFGLPELRGRVAIHPGSGPGLSTYSWGERGGIERVTLTQAEMPQHTHAHEIRLAAGIGDTSTGANNSLAASTSTNSIYSDIAPSANAKMNPAGLVIGNTGSSQSHTNLQPFNGIYHCIALVGIYPSRS